MAKAMTEKAVRALASGELADGRIRGLSLRVTPSNRKLWSYRYATGGRRRRMSLGGYPEIGLADARKLACDLALRVARGEDPAADRDKLRQSPTLNELLDRALREHWSVRCKPRTVQSVRGSFDLYVRPKLGQMQVCNIRRRDLEAWHQAVGKKTPTAANRTLAYLSKAFSLAVIWEWAPRNPCAGIDRFKERKVDRILTGEEVARLRQVTDEMHAEGYYPPALALPWFLLLTGLRRGEAVGLRWDDVDTEALSVHLLDSKVGERHVAIEVEALAMIDQLERRGPWVFPHRTDPRQPLDPSPHWERIRERAGIADVRLHDLRHSFASTLVKAGVHQAVIKSILGHASITTTERYMHANKAQEHEALSLAAAAIEGEG